MMTGKDLLDGKLGALTMPVLIGWGEKDRLIPLSVGYQLHSEILQSGTGCLRQLRSSGARAVFGQVGPSVVDFLNAQPARMAMVKHIPGTATNDSVFPGQ